MSAKEPQKKNWFATLPGVLTSLATLITAITALYVAIVTHQGGSTTTSEKNASAQGATSQGMHEQEKQVPKVKTSDPCKDLPFEQRPISCLK
jgi:hypothetical protein